MSTIILTLDNDADLVEAFRTGDRDRAATAFVRRHQRFVLSIAYRYLSSMDDAQDAAQDVFIRAIQGMDRFKGESSLQTWLYRITVNVCSNMRRRKRIVSFFAFGEGEGEQDVVSTQPPPSQQSEQSDFEHYFRGVLAKLPEKQRETFCLRYYDELSYDEISQMVGTSVGALKANYHHAVKKIATALRTSDYYETWLEHDADAR